MPKSLIRPRTRTRRKKREKRDVPLCACGTAIPRVQSIMRKDVYDVFKYNPELRDGMGLTIHCTGCRRTYVTDVDFDAIEAYYERDPNEPSH